MFHQLNLSALGRTAGALAVASALLLTGCGDPVVEAQSDADLLEVAISDSGDTLRASFDAASVNIEADARLVDADRYAITLTVGDDTIEADYDQGEGLALIEADGFVMDAAMADALERFAIALNTVHPDREGIENQVYRLASLYAVHPQGEPVEDNEIARSDDLRDWDDLCNEYYRGDYFNGTFDYECNCSWGFCDSCNGSWGSTVGGNNGDNSCYGVCGAGCGGGSDYTEDCADHDACLNAGYSQYQCADEFSSASDDALFSPVCTEMSLSYNVSNTNSANQNTATKNVYLTAGQVLDLGTCTVRGSNGSGDTYLRLFNGGTQVASNDDSCGLLSRLTYTATSSATYQIRAGCYGSGSCSGKASYTIR